ncbi:hypothetical protein PJI16_02120 [Nitrospira sp. MA-1]|nr:hypothetical protein [Nitrospira sp. MA-1]
MTPEDYMRLAIVMAQKVPQYLFGAVIVRRTTGDIGKVFTGFQKYLYQPQAVAWTPSRKSIG